MDKYYNSWKNLKQFSAFKPANRHFTLENLTGVPVEVAYKLHNRDTEFDCSTHHDSQIISSKGGYSFEILHLLQDVLKFRVNFKVLHEVYSQNMFNSTEIDDVDLIICHPSIETLPTSVDLLLPTLQSRLALLFKRSSLPIEKDLFVRNITGNVWFYLLGVLILLALCLRLSTHLHNSLKPKHSDWSWLEVIQWTLGAICQQGSSKHPQGCSCRTMFLIGYCITYLIYTGYAAGITSLLAVKSDTQELQWDVAMKLKLPFTALCNSNAERYLKNRMIDGKMMSYSKCLATKEQLVATVEDTNSVAVMSEASLVHYLTFAVNEDVRCKMSISKQIHHNYYSGFVVKQNSDLKHAFNYWLLRFKEHGLLKRMLGNSLKPLAICQMAPGYTEVGLEHVNSAFFIIRFHLIVSVVVFCLEVLLHKYGVLWSNQTFHKRRSIRFLPTKSEKFISLKKLLKNNKK